MIININKKARELMIKYPNGITVGELQTEILDESQRRVILARMIYFAQQEEENRILGPNLIR